MRGGGGGVLVRGRSLADREQSSFKQQHIWDSGTPETTFETARIKPRNFKSI